MGKQWSNEQAWKWYDKTPWLVGCNFLPSTAINDVEMWQGESFDEPTIARELGWAAAIGFNSIRVFLQYVVWEADPAGFMQRFERVLEIADANGMTVMPVLFDDCLFSGKQPRVGKQDDPAVGVHNSGWVPSPGKAIGEDPAKRPLLEQYITDMISRFADDPRVVVWDLYNEPGAAGEQFDSRSLLTATFDWAQAVRPSQPLTVGAFKGPGVDDVEQIQAKDECSRIMLTRSDVVSFHCYMPFKEALACVLSFKTLGRPMICTEWMARATMESLFQTHLPMWKEHRVGCYNWGLVAGRTQTFLPWNNPTRTMEPDAWHHDVLRKDGTPYDPAEIEALHKATGR
ncbi:MAG: cellulase family glycosylhydrolase [Planctomycetaceae bacterium]|nr:cellulase family glycosylhydrolase [Planctomycetaceae bacterium]